MGSDIVNAFLAALPPRAQDAGTELPNCAQRVEAAVDAAAAGLPDLGVSLADFAASWARRISPAEPLMQALEAPHLPDLLLAWACAGQSDAAQRQLEARYFGAIDAQVRRHRHPVSSDEVKQRLREKLFWAPSGEQPKILEYSGKGSLEAWLSVAIARTVINLATRGGREDPVSDDVLIDAAGAFLPSLAADLDRRELAEAFTQALLALPVRLRNVLRQRFLDGLSLAELSDLYSVNRATVSRWLAAAREEIIAHTREALERQLPGATASEVEGLLHSATDHLELSFRRLLRS